METLTRSPQHFIPSHEVTGADGVLETTYILDEQPAVGHIAELPLGSELGQPLPPAEVTLLPNTQQHNDASPIAPADTNEPDNTVNAWDAPSIWAAPQPANRVLYSHELPAGQTFTSPLAKKLDRIAKVLTKTAEVTQRGSELAHRFGAFAGHAALKTAVEVQSIPVTARFKREQLQASGETRRQRAKNVAARVMSNMVTLKRERVNYEEFLAARPTTIEQKQARSDERRQARRAFYERNLSPNAVAGAVGNASKEAATAAHRRAKKAGSHLVRHAQAAHVRHLHKKATLKEMEASLLKRGINEDGSRATKNTDRKAQSKAYSATRLRAKADYINIKQGKHPKVHLAA